MSVRIMTMVWDLDLSASQKIVLLALADCANDEGLAWPGVASLCAKCSKSERTVQSMLAELEKAQHITRHQVPGKGCRYQIHPGGITPANSAPRKICAPQKTASTPAKSAPPPAKFAPKPSKNRQEPSGGGARARADTPPGSKKGAGKVRPAAGAAKPVADDAGEALEPTAAALPAAGHRLPDNWTAPSIDDLPPMARNMASQWPAGAFETSCEAFRLHWQNETGPNAVKRDWGAALARWIMGDHPRFMRDAKAGISFDAAAPAKRSQPRATKLVAAKRFEDERSNMIRDELAKTIGQQAVDQWLAPAALIHDGASLRLVCASAFARDWVRDHFADQIAAAVRAAGIDRRSDAVSFEIEQTNQGDA